MHGIRKPSCTNHLCQQALSPNEVGNRIIFLEYRVYSSTGRSENSSTISCWYERVFITSFPLWIRQRKEDINLDEIYKSTKRRSEASNSSFWVSKLIEKREVHQWRKNNSEAHTSPLFWSALRVYMIRLRSMIQAINCNFRLI